jgi:proline iminopeptidase
VGVQYDGSNGKENNQMTTLHSQNSNDLAANGTTTEPSTAPHTYKPARDKIARAFKISLLATGGAVGALVLVAVSLYFATSGQYPVAVTVVDDATLPQIEIDGVRLHAETYGHPSNPVIIVLHGGPGGDYRSQLGAKALADTNFVVFYDQRGAGLSERVPAEDLTVPAYIAELDAVIENYSPDRPVTLLGHSWGAMLATAYLGEAPEKVARAILLEPGFFTAEEMQDWMVEAKPYRSGLGFYWQAATAAFQSLHVSGPDSNAAQDYVMGEIIHTFVNHPENPYHCPGEDFDAPAWRFGATASQTAGQTGAAEVELIAQGAESYPGPVLLLAGACNDWIGEDAQRTHLSFFQDGELSIVPHSGHDMIWDNPEETLPLIRAFLDM